MRYIQSFLLTCILFVSTETQAQWNFAISNGGGASVASAGTAAEVRDGYARIRLGAAGPPPGGLVIFGFRQNGVLVTEAAVGPSPLILSGRIFAETGGPVKTGIAIANPNTGAAVIGFHFTDNSGVDLDYGNLVLSPGQKISAFLTEAPFNGRSSFSGTFTFDSSLAVTAASFRGYTNTRSEFLITTLPVIDLNAPQVTEPAVFPNFANGGGWVSQLVLVNPRNVALSGTIQFRDPNGGPAGITVNGAAATDFSYAIAPGSAVTLQTDGLPGPITTGFVRVVPDSGSATPRGAVVFSMTQSGIRVTEAGARDTPPSTAFRMYAEVSGAFAQPGPIQSAIAAVNPNSSVATVTVELTELDGQYSGWSGTFEIPPNGQVTRFLNEIPGLTPLPAPFQGLAHITSNAPISVMGLRGRYNERRDFLITTTPPMDEMRDPPSDALYFPHVADSGGYSTQFILFGNSSDHAPSGDLQILSASGGPMAMPLGGNPSLGYASVAAGPHPLVARYDVSSILSGEVTVEFGTGTDYGRQTAAFRVAPGGTVRVLVAGMMPETEYHLRAKLLVDGNVRWTDVDRVFATGKAGSIPLPNLTVTRSPSLIAGEGPGVELIAFAPPVAKSTREAFVTDRDGNLLWFYDAPVLPQFLKLMPNGHLLVALAPDRLTPRSIREVDLEGTTIRELDSATMDSRMKQSGFTSNFRSFSHDFIPMANGHLLVLGQNSKSVQTAGLFGPVTRTLMGDVIVDLDADWQPVWVWSAFDHLDVDRHPMGLPDWTHGNAIVYNNTDGNLLISMRHQAWILNLDYRDGLGSGRVLWRLGKDGDFTLEGGDLSQWFYAQHMPDLLSVDGSRMTLAVFDNGNSRYSSDGTSNCGSSPYPACYTRATVFEIDQSSMSARLQWAARQDVFSAWGGAIVGLPGGNVEFEMSQGISGGSRIREVTRTDPSQVLWQMDLPGGASYRSYRIPSLYPGVTWP